MNSFIKPIPLVLKVSNGAKIRNRYNQVPHLTQDTNGKPHFWIRICSFLMILFLPKFMMMLTTLILKIVKFQFLDVDVSRSTSYGVYISQLIQFDRASSHVADLNTRNKLLTQKLLKLGYRYHKLCKTVSKFYRRYYDLISKFNVVL